MPPKATGQLDAPLPARSRGADVRMIIVVNKWDLVTGGEFESRRPSKAMRMREANVQATVTLMKSACATISSF